MEYSNLAMLLVCDTLADILQACQSAQSREDCERLHDPHFMSYFIAEYPRPFTRFALCQVSMFYDGGRLQAVCSVATSDVLVIPTNYLPIVVCHTLH